MSATKVVYIISEINKSLAFEWIAERLDKKRFTLCFFLIGDKNTALSDALKKAGIPYVEFPFRSKTDIPVIFVKILLRLGRMRPNVVHTHLFYANIIGLTASWLLRIRKRIFTRHHAMVHYDEYPQGLKWDKYFNMLATHIVAISENTRDILIKSDKADAKKIQMIHHGFNLDYFKDVNEVKIHSLRDRYKLEGKYPVVGVIARYLKLKGIQFIVPAFKNLRKEFPNAHLVLANTVGNYSAEIKELLKTLPEASYTEIEFEEDLATLYRLFDVYVHVPTDARSEAFGQTYIEALASGIPSVFTLSGVAPEFIQHELNALVVKYKDSDEIENSIKRLLMDAELRSHLIENGKKTIEQFSLETMIANLTKMYE